MDSSGNLAALLSSGLVQRHLLPRLDVHDLLSVEGVSTGFKHLLNVVDEGVWSAAIRTQSPCHPLALVKKDVRQAVRQYAELREAIKYEDASVMCAAICAV